MNNSKFFLFLALVSVTLLLANDALVYKFISFFGATISVGTLIISATYILYDVISEVYGYSSTKKLIWSAYFCEMFFILITCFFSHLNSPSWNNNKAYLSIFGNLYLLAIAHLIAVPVGFFGNIYILLRWKTLSRGRYFWLRSLCASAVGEFLFSAISVIIVVGFIYPEQVINVILSTYFYKLFFNFIMILPASFLAFILKKKENINIFDYKFNLNPFKS